MQIKASEIREIIKAQWPDIQFVWMQDRFYDKPSIKGIEGLLISSGVAKLRPDGELMDCDDYALLANAYIKKFCIDTPTAKFQVSFGEAFGTRFRGVDNIHTLNICLAQEGLFLIEPQTYEYWQPSKKDSILIVKM